MYSYRPPHMDVQKQDDQHELTYSNYVRTRDVTLRTCQRRWLIGRSGERGSGISVLVARHDDDDDDYNSCCRCSFEAEIIKIGQSSHKMFSNNILNFQESTTILDASTKMSGNKLKAPHIYIYREREREMVWFGGFYGISTFVGYLMPNPFLCK